MFFALGGSWYGISPLSLLLLKSLYYDEQMHSIQVMCFKKKTKWKIKKAYFNELGLTRRWQMISLQAGTPLIH